ncbi:MAG: ParB N-terminal domain-containing protein [Gilliamella sp.]|uniref:ParB family protein n=1 Tax=Gilliamella sp. TaxID=1891236 RepID=UPI0025EF4EC5|nr:ParB family protein [Gilliamella sp.]MCO6550368.1 ParB N-terminal domain-containing protein [Gilliamella sp.]
MVEQKSSVDVMRERISTGFPDGDRATTKITLNEMPMRVNLDELRPSQVLPRLKKNESYEDIKESIRKKGLDHAPAITKIPGEEGYVISDGGNTRLQILKELYEETGDKRFYTINCIFRPWGGELKSIVGHLTENGLRSDYTFIEKALGVSKSKTLYEKEAGKQLSSRELSECLKNHGYPISHTLINKMLNTVDYLYPHIPEILKLGLSRNQIEKILMLRSICWDLYKRSEKYDDDNAFVEGFNLVLSEFDYEPELFSYERLQDEMFGYFAKLLGISYQIFEFELEEKKHKGIKKNLSPIDVSKNAGQGGLEVVPTLKDQSLKDQLQQDISSETNVSSQQSTKVDPISLKRTNPTIISDDEPESETAYTVLPSGDITVHDGADVELVMEDIIKSTDLTKINPHAYSLSANLNTYGKTERTPILDIWKLPEEATNYEYVFRDIAGHVLDIFDELGINNQSFAFSIDDKDKSKLPIFAFNPLSTEDEVDSKKRTAYKLLLSLLTKQTEELISMHYLITEFNDFLVIKFLRIIRLFRVYNEFLNQQH